MRTQSESDLLLAIHFFAPAYTVYNITQLFSSVEFENTASQPFNFPSIALLY